METRASYVLIGAFTLLVFLSAFAFVMWIGKVSLEREWDYYDIVFKEPVTGLTVGGAVQYNGIQVGEVRKLSLAPDDPRQVIAHARLSGNTPVRTDTKATLVLLGLTGVTAIQLSGGSPSAPRLQPAPGETAARIVADTSAMQSLLASGQDIAGSTNNVLLRVNRLLSDDNMNHVASTLAHVDEVTATFAEQRSEWRSLVGQLGAASARLDGTLRRIDKLAVSGDRLANRDMRDVLQSARRTLDSANSILEQSRAPVASFNNEGLTQIGPTLTELRQTLQSLRAITTRLQNDPAAYLRGGEQIKEFEPR